MKCEIYVYRQEKIVTILILVDGFLQLGTNHSLIKLFNSHNPYFSRWFSAIVLYYALPIKECSHNPYFSRWFSAM